MTQAFGSRTLRQATVMALSLCVLAAAGCGLFQTGPDVPERYNSERPPRDLPNRSKKALIQHVVENAKKFGTLTADCEAVIMSPLMSRRKRVRMSGELYLKKPGKIHLRLYGGGKLYVELQGNGEAYRVNMPLFDNTRYSGKYGDPIRYQPGRLHFMPDDVVDCLSRANWFGGKIQVLRALKKPAEWQIDNLKLQEGATPSLTIESSIQINRRNQQVVEYTKFANDASVRLDAWFRNVQLVQTGERSVRIPSVIWLRYPMEGTWIGLQLSGINLNVEIKPEHFVLN